MSTTSSPQQSLHSINPVLHLELGALGSPVTAAAAGSKFPALTLLKLKVYGLLVPDTTDVIRGFVEERKKLQILVLIVVKDGNGLEETVTFSLDFTVSMVYPGGHPELTCVRMQTPTAGEAFRKRTIPITRVVWLPSEMHIFLRGKVTPLCWCTTGGDRIRPGECSLIDDML
ncbi:hypothetical protein C8Q76DRAFT_698111 [Earliella scabrosa]|nr:hypothetical protein C8Q76DRAFT_698111 [Earliella scabrosa]